MLHFDHIVVGGGLIGSAAAKYLAESGDDVLIIGASEPKDYAQGDVFASHYDNSRVARVISWNSTWTQLSQESAAYWPILQEESGIELHDPSGCLYLAPTKDAYLQSAPELAAKFSLKYSDIKSNDDVKAIAPELYFDRPVVGLYEGAPAGSINPRAVVAAQQKALSEHGGKKVDDVVVSITKKGSGYVVTTQSAQNFECTNVLVAAGSFSRFHSLLPRPIAIETKTEVVVIAKVSEQDGKKLSHMPSLLYEIYEKDFDGIYMVKPARYSDGNWYLKMGLNQKIDKYCDQLSQLQNWFRSDEHTAYLPVLERELKALLPTIAFQSLVTKPCVISRTPTENPYIDSMQDGFFLATGCQGYSAMNSDAQGKVAATLMRTGNYPKGYNHKDFAIKELGL